MFIAIETLRMEAHSHSRFECIQCNRTFTLKQHLLRHKKSIHDKLSYTCGRCFKTFNRADALKRHQNSCKYVCTRCKKKFDIMNHLIVHMRVCPIPTCAICNDKFESKEELKKS